MIEMGYFIFEYVKTVGGYLERIFSFYRECNVNLSRGSPSLVGLVQKS